MSKNRRTHSSIDKLPADLRDTLTRMIVDNEWPDDFDFSFHEPRRVGEERYNGKPRYTDLLFYCAQKKYRVSESAIGRFGMRMRMLARMKNAGVVVRDVMQDLTAEKASETQKAVAEMITAVTIDFVSSNDNFDAKEIKDIARAIKDCTLVSINADKYIREQVGKKVQAAADSTKKKLTKAGVNRKLIQEIIDEHLGVVKS